MTSHLICRVVEARQNLPQLFVAKYSKRVVCAEKGVGRKV